MDAQEIPIVFDRADDAQREYIQSLQDRVHVYEEAAVDAALRVFELKERVLSRLRARGWTDDDVAALLAEEAPDGGQG